MKATPWIGVLAVCIAAALVAASACDSGSVVTNNSGDGAAPDPCTEGTDADGDGHAVGCAQGADCNDEDNTVYPGAAELCDGKDNDCDGETDEECGAGCGPDCTTQGQGKPFPIDPGKDPAVKVADGVQLDQNGDLVLDQANVAQNYLWIANTYGVAGSAVCSSATGYDKTLCRGTISKVDTDKGAEVARYYTVTCRSNPGQSGCVDVNGKPLVKNFRNLPSRTAVDFNMDVWVANRAFDGQASVSKIAHDPTDCIDRNNNGVIDTSKDQNGDGKITVDCDGDKLPDNLSTTCSGALSGNPPEFLGDDDECILFTTAYADKDDIGRSVCLDAGKSMIGASNAWVGTYSRPENGRGNNQYYKINGTTGAIEATVTMPKGHHAYGCTADGENIIWSTDRDNGNLAYFRTLAPYTVGKLLVSDKVTKVPTATRFHYGIAVDGHGHLWLGGAPSSRLLRYKPDRQSFDTLHQGSWTIIHMPCPGTTPGTTSSTRGVAPDNRGKVWLACTTGTVIRVNQSIADGVHDLTGTKNVWKLKASGVIGVGIDSKGNVWGIGHQNDLASRLDVDAQGNVTANSVVNVQVGRNPYTYSDFTGFGLRNFVRPQGRWSYLLKPCADGKQASWTSVSWKAGKPPGTDVVLRVRTGDTEVNLGPWSQPFPTSPADLAQHQPNPSALLQLEFTLTSADKVTSPTLQEVAVGYSCAGVPE